MNASQSAARDRAMETLRAAGHRLQTTENVSREVLTVTCTLAEFNSGTAAQSMP